MTPSTTWRASRSGVLFVVVGPSGVGKDTLIDAARDALSGDHRIVFAQRVVTRPANAGGEAHEAMDAATFAANEERGAFAVTWRAHGLAYGVRREAIDVLQDGRNVVVNASRRAIASCVALAERTVVLAVTASQEVVRRRLEARGREDAAEVAARLARDVPLTGVRNLATIDNGGELEDGIAAFLTALLGAARLPLHLVRSAVELAGERLALLPEDSAVLKGRHVAAGGLVEVFGAGNSVRARLALAAPGLLPADAVALSAAPFARLRLPEGAAVEVRRAPILASRDSVRKKVAGEELTPAEITAVVRDLVEGRYGEAEAVGFVIAASRQLSVAEVAAMTAARAEVFERMDWGGRLVVDQHSMGGVPGSCIAMIVVPIVAAHGLPIAKTSSRAITSVAGTADVMECIARVDLTPGELKSVVESAGGAIAWSGRINHSPLDDAMNAIVRPLGFRSAGLDVSSILSKTLAVGATHVVVDVPVGPGTRTASAARMIVDLFEEVGHRVGLTVAAHVTDGSHPIGNGVGPALELADVEAVLRCDPAAPVPLAEKALDFAAAQIAWDPAVPEGTERARAGALLRSGAAEAQFRAIVAAQGTRPRERPGAYSVPILAPRAGRVEAIDGILLGGLARAAGAPQDKAAGVRLNVRVGDAVAAGAVLMEAVASSPETLDPLAHDAAALVTLR